MPILSANALCDHVLSTLTPSTSASSWSNDRMSLTKQTCSFVQVGLQSSGYHTSTTFFLPAKSESFTSFLSWFCSAKSGAVCPTAIAMFFPPIDVDSRPLSYPIHPPPPNGPARSHSPGRTLLGYTSFRKSAADDAMHSGATRGVPMMPLRALVDRYLSAAGGFGIPAALSSFALSTVETERLFSSFDEDYHISRFFHFSKDAGTPFSINGFPATHVAIDAEIESIL